MLQDIISILGMANPQLSFNWQEGGLPSVSADQPLTLKSNSSAGEWLAPAAGLMNKLDEDSPGPSFASRLRMGDGKAPDPSIWVIKLHPQVYTRLQRLYSKALEGKTGQTDKPIRPVPLYFAYHDSTEIGVPKGGNTDPGGRLTIKGGKLSVHDEAGQLIDPLAVASAFMVIAQAFPAIIAKTFVSTSINLTSTQLSQLTTGLDSKIRVRLVSLFRDPFSTGTTQFTNLTDIRNAEGLYEMTNSISSIEVVTSPTSINTKFEIGTATFGTLGATFTLPALKAGVTMKRDFLTLFADDINVHIRGKALTGAPYNNMADYQVPVFHNENLDLLINGSQVLAKGEQAVRNSDNLSLVVAPVIASDFAVAADPANAEWPAFPAGSNGDIAGKLHDLKLTAHFLKTPADQRDVFLKLEVPETSPGKPQLVAGTAVRIYERKLLADAKEGRGNGAGGILNTQFSTGFILKNPFSFTKTETLPLNPKLLFDLVAVNRTGQKRSFGLLGTDVAAPSDMTDPEKLLASKGSNQFSAATEQSIAPAGILGLSTTSLNALPSITDFSSAINVAISLGNEGLPRIAPRQPLMVRNENIIAGRNAAGAWSSVMSGLWLRGDSRSSLHRVGSPGSPGGEEFLGIGFGTSGGLLAYQIARAALRRTKGLPARLQELETNNKWALPTPASTGNFSAAILQDITPGADSAALNLIPDAAFNILPGDWSGLVSGISNIIPSAPASNTQVKNAITSLQNSLKGQLLYSEFRHEVVTARTGRRDSLPVLTSAIQSAKDLIYLETGTLSFTDYAPDDITNTDPPNEVTDLVSLMAKQLTENKGLHLILVVSKEVVMGPGYESFAARAYDRRMKAIQVLKEAAEDRVQLFHPMGFPGRPIRLMHTLMIVDDMWLFGGSGTFNRRGFMFDGNLSMVCFNREIENGRSKAIRSFRRKLMANHLGSEPLPGSPAATLAHPNEARLADISEAYFAVAELLDQGGSGFIQKLFEGKVTGQESILQSSFPHRDLADPDGVDFPFKIKALLAALMEVFIGLGEAEA